MEHRDRWEIIDDNTNSGGQGKVYKVIDKSIFDRKKAVLGINNIISGNMNEFNYKDSEINGFLKCFDILNQAINPSNYYALKVLHSPEKARDSSKQFERIKKEINVMSKNIHKNLLQIVEYDKDVRKKMIL